LRASQSYLPTLREAPTDAELISHRLLVRGGFIRRQAAGVYTYMPLGWRVLRKLEQIVREEMDRTGALELLMPALVPWELLEQTGRHTVDVLFKVHDRQGRPFSLGFTHEEIITDIFRHTVHSYKDLPLTLYQIQTKFRDEPRPRAGLIRAREFIMKDAYSFHLTEQCLDQTYRRIGEAYTRSFRRMGLDTLICDADPGAIGGSENKEYMVVTPAGEDTVLQCTVSGYTANAERAELPDGTASPVEPGDSPAHEDVATPGAHTVEQVAAFLGVAPTRIVKTLLYMADGKPVGALIRGDRDLNEGKFRRALGAQEIRMMEPAEVEKHSRAPVGFAGPIGLDGVRLIADYELKTLRDFVVGANKDETHTVHVCHGRDFPVNEWADLRVAVAGDPTLAGGVYTEVRGIEVGHIFQLGIKYSASLDANIVDAEGVERPAVMGCYGLGISRCMSAVAEVHNDADGLAWPASIAPLEVVVIPASPDAAVLEAAERLYTELRALGVEVLLDDRDERAGVKFKDADLIGWPVQVVVGKSLSEGNVEVGLRRERARRPVPLADAAKVAADLLAREKEHLSTG